MSLRLSIQPEEMKERFLALRNVQDVVGLLEIEKARLNYYLYISPLESRYTTFEIPKRSGGTRQINAPISSIKIVQRKLNQVLQTVYKRRNPVHSFLNKRSIITNAKRHVSKRWVLNIDLQDFFPTISFQRIRGMLLKKPYSLEGGAATVIAQICCCDGKLPQGAPTSPIISNMICSKLDNELNRMANKNGCVYTRYADDLTFSIDEDTFPEKLAKKDGDGNTVVGDEVKQIISENWFAINNDKVKLRRDDMRQEVTGLTVNKKVNVRRRYVKQIRAMLHCWERYGLSHAQTEYISRHHERKHRSPEKAIPEFKSILYGKLCFLRQVIGEQNPVYLRYFKQFQRLDLLDMYNEQKENTDNAQRGIMLEKIIGRLFEINGFEVVKSFRRNSGGEQIDGACIIEGCYYLIECKWQTELSSPSDTDTLSMKVSRSAINTRGLFVSINGWTGNVPRLLKRNPNKNIMLMNGSDIEYVLEHRVNLNELIKAKERHLNIRAEPYFKAENLL